MIDALTTSALFLGNARSDAADRFARQPGTGPADRPVGDAQQAGPKNATGPNLTAAPVPPLDISSQTTAQEQEPEDGKQQSSGQTPEQAAEETSPPHRQERRRRAGRIDRGGAQRSPETEAAGP
jgi:hypothetical protein